MRGKRIEHRTVCRTPRFMPMQSPVPIDGTTHHRCVSCNEVFVVTPAPITTVHNPIEAEEQAYERRQ